MELLYQKENFFASQQDTDHFKLSKHKNGKYLEWFNNYVENVYSLEFWNPFCIKNIVIC